MIEKDIVDRVPTYAGRIKLTPVSGQADVFTMERADEPTVEGTPLDKSTFESIIQSRLTGRFYEPTVLSTKNMTFDTEVYNNEFEVKNGVPLDWTTGQRITVFTPETDTTITIAENTFNGIKVNTILQSNRRYELLYNGSSFDVKEL